MTIHLTDDGTMDTVLRCSACGEEFRFNYQDSAEPDTRKMDPEDAYDDFVQECIDEIADEHECEEASAEENPREKGDDDGVEYGDPRDARDERDFDGDL